MRNWKRFLVIALCCSGCTMTTPEQYFSVAVLNSNYLHGFAGRGFQNELENPSVKLVEGTTDSTVTMTHRETVADKIKRVEENLDRIRELKVTNDSREIIQASIALHDYALKVYRSEYLPLAELYDSQGQASQKEALLNRISTTYHTGFVGLQDRLVTAGKVYAQQNNIQVNWDIQTAP